MNLKEWNSLLKAEQDKLVAKFGLTRKGAGNELVSESELEKIKNIGLVAPTVIEPVEEIKPKKYAKTKKPIVKKVVEKPVKLGSRRRPVQKPKRRAKK